VIYKQTTALVLSVCNKQSIINVHMYVNWLCQYK